MTIFKNTLGVLAAVVLTVAACVGLWALYWFLAVRGTDNATHVLQHSYGANQGKIDAAREKISELTGLADGPQKTAITTQVCALITDLTGNVPADLSAFSAQECAQ